MTDELGWKYQDETEIEKLVEVFKKISPRRHILEIGSLWGGTLKRWIDNAEPNATIISVDAIVPQNDKRYVRQRHGHDVEWRQWAYDKGHRLYVFDRDSRQAETAAIVKSILPVLDFCFIDGGHEYETALSDWLTYGRMVRPGGVVAFHDLGTEHPGVRPVWEMASHQRRREEFCVNPGMYGIGVMYA